MAFNKDEWLRYTRHIQLPQIGAEGQNRLKNAKVLMVGAGGLGSPVGFYLAAAGIGKITIIDGDTVDLSNLQRQILFTTNDIGKSKAVTAKQRLLALNPSINVTAIEDAFNLNNAEALIKSHDLMIDCTDNFATRYLINDYCVQLKKPWVFASIFQFSGQCALFTPQSACFRCVFPEAPVDAPDCNSAGVLGVLPGILGCLQANEAIKYLTGIKQGIENNLLIVEALSMEFRKIKLQKNPECQACGEAPSTDLLSSNNPDYAVYCSTDNLKENEVDVASFQKTDADNTQIIDVRSKAEHQAFNIGGENIPLENILHEDFAFDEGKTVVCYCQSGARSLKAANHLNSQGIHALSLQGGLNNYLKRN